MKNFMVELTQKEKEELIDILYEDIEEFENYDYKEYDENDIAYLELMNRIKNKLENSKEA